MPITIKEITLHQHRYPITISGNGDQSMLIIGVGTLTDRTLSEQLRDQFTICSSDLYWVGSDNVQDISMDALAADIESVRRQLGLEKPILVAHSAYGPLAIHVAKLFPDNIGGVLMLGSPPGWNDPLVRKNQQHFDEHADTIRKAIDESQRRLYPPEILDTMDPYERFLTIYADLDRARYWYDANYDSRPLWDGLTANMPVFDGYFAKTLPPYNVEDNIEKVACPVLLAAGDYDYDCCPALRWQELEHKPTNFVIEEFHSSGHYPHFEEASVFDARFFNWAESNKFLKPSSGESSC